MAFFPFGNSDWSLYNTGTIVKTSVHEYIDLLIRIQAILYSWDCSRLIRLYQK